MVVPVLRPSHSQLEKIRTIGASGVGAVRGLLLCERDALHAIAAAVQEALRGPACPLARYGERLSCVGRARSDPNVGATPVLLEEAVAASA
jgi:hypothetical protein